MKKIAILGGGLLGRLLAINLSRAGISVCVWDSGSSNGEQSAAYVAAAMLAPLAESIDTTSHVVQLGIDSLPLWRKWIASLAMPVMLQEQGTLVVWHAQDKPLAEQFMRQLEQYQSIGGWQTEYWYQQQLQMEEPQLSQRFQQGLFLPGEGQLDNRQLLLALAHELEQLKVPCYWGKKINRSELQTQYDYVIDTRGIGAKNDWNQLSGSQLRGVRGEVVRVFAPEVSLNRPIRLLHPRYPLYIAPKQNHIFVIGATQLESEDSSQISVRGTLELLSALYTVHPAFGEARVLEAATGLRPTLNHEQPEIRYTQEQRLIEVNGLFRHGFMIAPAVCEAVMRLQFMLLEQQSISEKDSQTGIVFHAI